MAKTRIGILGYGKLSRGVEAAVVEAPDMQLAAIFTRRDPAALSIASKNVPVYAAEEVSRYSNEIDVMILGGGSATDLPKQTVACARHFNVVDSFDTHANIPKHFAAVDAALMASGHVGAISVGWDPGLFSLARLIGNALLPQGNDYTFWGRGVSQGHSDAIRRIPGVVDACQYTVPVPEAIGSVRSGKNPTLTARQMHTRECYVVAEEGADRAAIERAIVTMPNYFAPYDTTVLFVTEDELKRNHAGIPHGGSVFRSGTTAQGDTHMMEFDLRLESNPAFTGSVLVAVARAVARMAAEGVCGCKTIFDIPPAYYSPRSGEELRAHLL